jgi:hypothetical protein
MDVEQQGPEQGSDMIDAKVEPSSADLDDDFEDRGQDLIKQLDKLHFRMADLAQDNLSSQNDAQAAMTRQQKILVDLQNQERKTALEEDKYRMDLR